MSIAREQIPHSSNTFLVTISGRLDQALIPQLEDTLNELLDEGTINLLVDLSQTTYINSGGLRCLVSAWRRARATEGTIRLCGLSPRLKDIFSMVGFDKVFEIDPDCERARSSANERPQ